MLYDESGSDLDQTLNSFLDVKRVWLEPTSQLSCHFINEIVMTHVLTIFHYTNDTGLGSVSLTIGKRIR